MENLKTVFAQIESDYKKAFAVYVKKEKEALAKINNGLVPNVDRLGRFHAAIDGYCDTTDRVYLKGQFIPMSESNDDHLNVIEWLQKNLGKGFKDRVKIQGDLIDFVKSFEAEGKAHKVNNVLFFSLGKQWDQGGVNTCYLYIEGMTKAITKKAKQAIIDFVESQETTEKEEVKGIAPTGKQVIQGTVIGLPIYDGYYGIQHKMMIKLDNGSTVFGSLPSKIFEVEIGQKVTFSANFEHSKEDNTHAFFKRPTKAAII